MMSIKAGKPALEIADEAGHLDANNNLTTP